jgi:hypothetical protein
MLPGSTRQVPGHVPIIAVSAHPCVIGTIRLPPLGEDWMSIKRREFLTLIAGSAAFPVAASAQQVARQQRMAMFHPAIPGGTEQKN